MLNISGLCVDYGTTRVINKLDLNLEDNEILMLVGPTGCGKTTILQALAGLVPIKEGEIKLGDWTATPENQIPPEQRNVGMVFQDFALFPHLTVEENVGFRLQDKTPADHWIELLDLNDFRNAKPGTLSGGQKQRVALARTLAHAPKFVLLDEPLSNLDAALKDSLRWEIRNALKSAGIPAIWVTHDQDEALSVGDRLGILDKGVLVQLASPEECFSRPENRFAARFLGEASFISGELEGDQIKTELGTVQVINAEGKTGEAELLLRPDDLSIAAVELAGNGKVEWVRYEGGTWLISVVLASGQSVQVRINHESQFVIDQRVQLNIIATQALPVF